MYHEDNFRSLQIKSSVHMKIACFWFFCVKQEIELFPFLPC